MRECEVWKLKQIAKPLDVVMSHDWPRGIVEHGNLQQLLRYKSFLRDEVREFFTSLKTNISNNAWYCFRSRTILLALLA